MVRLNLVHVGQDYGYGEWVVKCPQCGKERVIRAYKYKNGFVRSEDGTCRTCMGKNRSEEKVLIRCPACGEERRLGLADSKQRLSQYCRKCVKTHHKPTIRDGRHILETSRGYVTVMGLKHHPLANKTQQVPEHWMVMYEQHPAGSEQIVWFKKNKFTIHHKDGVRSNNAFNNLELRAPGRHGVGWSIEDMREVIARYDGVYK